MFFGWYIVAASVALYILVGGTLYYGFPVFYEAILREYPWSRASTAGAFAIQALVIGLLSPGCGWLVDRFGTRGPLMAGVLLLALGCWILSRTDSLADFYLGFGVVGFGFVAFWIAPIAAINNWFSARRALALGIAVSGYGVSGVLAPVISWAVQAYGWRAVFLGIAAGLLALVMPLCLVIRHRPEPYGWTVDGAPASPGTDGVPVSREEEGRVWSAPEVLRSRTFWLLVVLFTACWLPWTGIVPHMITYLVDVGIALPTAALAITAVTMLSVVGRVSGGFLGDRIDKRRLLATAMCIVCGGTALFAWISESWQLLLFVVVFGPALGVFSPTLPALIGDYFGTRSFALIFGLLTVPNTLLLFAVPSAVGWVYDRFGGYEPAWLVMAVVTLIFVPITSRLRKPAPVPI